VPDFASLIAFILPAYVANAAPVLLGGGAPMDMGRRLKDGERVLGDKKTIRGFVGGVAAGTLVGGLLALYFPVEFFSNTQQQFLAGFMLSFGALAGDGIGSFIKRRMKLDGGRPFFLDSILFILVALALAYPFTNPNAYALEFFLPLIVLTLILHPLTNFIANKIGLKNVPW
jgi:CDP-2,3-bis-(O-geranylgeranyl)-sn-glycerol synthase